jgi:hypothetical protein
MPRHPPEEICARLERVVYLLPSPEMAKQNHRNGSHDGRCHVRPYSVDEKCAAAELDGYLCNSSGTSIQSALFDRDVAAARLFRQGIPGECKSASPRAPAHVLELATSTLTF